MSPDLPKLKEMKEDLVYMTTNQRKASMKRGQTENFINEEQSRNEDDMDQQHV